MTQSIKAITDQLQIDLLLSGVYGINPWTKKNFLDRVNALFERISPLQGDRDNFNIETLQIAILIGQGSLTSIRVSRTDQEPIAWDITKNKTLITAAQELALLITSLFQNLVQHNYESLVSNRRSLPEKWNAFASAYQKEQQVANMWVKLRGAQRRSY